MATNQLLNFINTDIKPQQESLNPSYTTKDQPDGFSKVFEATKKTFEYDYEGFSGYSTPENNYHKSETGSWESKNQYYKQEESLNYKAYEVSEKIEKHEDKPQISNNWEKNPVENIYNNAHKPEEKTDKIENKTPKTEEQAQKTEEKVQDKNEKTQKPENITEKTPEKPDKVEKAENKEPATDTARKIIIENAAVKTTQKEVKTESKVPAQQANANTKEVKADIKEAKAEAKDVKTDAKAELKDTKTELGNTKEAKSDVKAEIKDLKAEIKEVKTDVKAEIKDLKAEIKEMRVDNNNAKDSKIDLKQELAKADSNSDSQKQQKEADLNLAMNNKKQEQNFQQELKPKVTSSQTSNTEIAGQKVDLQQSSQFEKVMNSKQPQTTQHSVLNQVKEASAQLTKGKSEITIALKPENLGRVNLNLVSKNGVLTAQITAESQQVKDMLTKGMESLRQNLSEQGVNVGRININVQEPSSTNNNSNFDQAMKEFGTKSGSSETNPEANKQSGQGDEAADNLQGSLETGENPEGEEKDSNPELKHLGSVDYKV